MNVDAYHVCLTPCRGEVDILLRAKAIHNQMNVMPLHVEIVRQMTSHFNSLKDPAKNLTLRQWLSTQLLTEQFQYGTTSMKKMLNDLLKKAD